MCKVGNCKQNHQKHYCKICLNPDSDHKSPQCPESSTVYFATTSQVHNKILSYGFMPSHYGTVEQGVYFSKTLDQATKFAKKWFKNGQIIVLECKVPTQDVSNDNLIDLSKQQDKESIKQKLYKWFESSKKKEATKVRLPWSEKQGICVKDCRRIKIIKKHDIK